MDFNPDTEHVEQTFREIAHIGAELVSNVFQDCTFDRCTFAGTVFRRCRFINCAFDECDLSLARFPGTVFSGGSFSRCKLVGVNWPEAGWPETPIGQPLKFESCNLSHSTFLGLRLRGLRIFDSQANGVDFREADLAWADFSGTDLDASLFLRTALQGADLSRARNYHMCQVKTSCTAPGLPYLKPCLCCTIWRSSWRRAAHERSGWVARAVGQVKRWV